MRVLIVSDVSGNMHGGVPTETVHLLHGLSARGHELALCADVPPRGVKDVACHFPLTIPTDGDLRRQVGKAVESFDPDVIHVMAMSSRGLFQMAPLVRGRHWVLTCHSVPPYERKIPWFHAHEPAHYAARTLRYLPHAAAWKWLFRRGMVPHAIVHSEVVRDIVVRYGQPACATSLIHFGGDFADLGIATLPAAVLCATAGPRILTMGGIAHTKGLHDAVVALAELRRDFPALSYQIIGEIRDPSYMHFLRRTIDRLGLSDCVCMTPSLPQAQKQDALRSADLYLQPSHEEGFCLAYIEAAVMVPRLVGTDTGAIRLIGAGDQAVRTVPIRQPGQMAAAIRELLAADLSPDVLVRRGERLRRRFSWSAYLDDHEALYRRATA